MRVWSADMAMRTPVASPVWALLGSTLAGWGWSGGGGAGFSACGAGFCGLVGMGMASGLGTSIVRGLGATGAGLGASVVRTLSVLVGWRGGRGSELTMVA